MTQPTDYQISEARMFIRLARFMIQECEKRGLTHGEKHHWQFVAIQLMECALSELDDGQRPGFGNSDRQDLKPDQVPF